MRSTIALLGVAFLAGCGGISAQDRYNAESKTLDNLEWELAEAQSELNRAVMEEAQKVWDKKYREDPNYQHSDIETRSLFEELNAKFPELKSKRDKIKAEVETQRQRVEDAKEDLDL